MRRGSKQARFDAANDGTGAPRRERNLHDSGVRARARTWSAGERLGRYLLTRPLGRPDVPDAQSFLALAPSGADVVLRISRRRADPADPVRRARDLGVGLRVRGLARVLDGGELDGRPWLAREAVTGLPLHRVLSALRQRGRAMEAGWAGMIALRLAGTLGRLHRTGWLHGAVRPRHVLLGRDGAITLIDLGRARRVGSTEPPALPLDAAPYAAPEAPAEAKADVYALGMTLAATLVTGRPRLRVGAPASFRRLQAASPELVPLVGRCVAPSNQRLATMPDVVRALRRALPGVEGWNERGLAALLARGLRGAGTRLLQE